MGCGVRFTIHLVFCPRSAPRLISCPLLFDIGYFPRPAPRIIFCLLILLVDGVLDTP